MPIVSLHFSISPGCVPAVMTTVRQAVRDPAMPPGLLAAYLAEIGEVNTLCCFFQADEAGASLLQLDRWLDALSAAQTGPHLRHIEKILHHCEALSGDWQRLVQASSVALVQLVFDQPPAQPGAASIVLHPITGRHGKTWVLSAVPSHDAALALCTAGCLDPLLPLRDAALWIPAQISAQ